MQCFVRKINITVLWMHMAYLQTKHIALTESSRKYVQSTAYGMNDSCVPSVGVPYYRVLMLHRYKRQIKT